MLKIKDIDTFTLHIEYRGSEINGHRRISI